MAVLDYSFSTLLGAAGGAWIAWLVSVIIYRFFFHPLSHFPGPPLAIGTYLYELYYDVWLSGQYTFKLKELHEIYGPVIRINPDELHINDPHFYDEVYNNSNGNVEKPFKQANVFGPFPAAIGTVEHGLHRIRRGAVNPFFSRRSVGEIMPFLAQILEKFCERLEVMAQTGELLNLKYAYPALTTDNMNEYCFSKSTKLVMSPDFNRKYFDDIDSFMEMSLLNLHIPWLFTPFYTLPDWLGGWLVPAMKDTFKFRQEIGEQVEAIRSGKDRNFETSGHKTIFHSLLSSDLPASELAPSRVRDEAFSLVTAGSFTVAFVLKSTSYFIMADPQVHEKLVRELRTAIPRRTDTPNLNQLEQLPYLTAVILEGLRSSDAVAHRMLRSFPDKALEYKGQVIPPGTPVSLTSLLIHNNEEIFPEPRTFKPERWLDHPELQRYLTPFSRGTRGCLGITLAWAEMYMVLGCLFRRFEFDVSQVNRERDIDCSRDVLLSSPAADSPGVIVKVNIVE